MPPKRSTRATTVSDSKKTTTTKTSTTAVATTKRKASEDQEESAPKKRGRPARSSTASADSEKSKVEKAAPRRATKATTKTASKATTTKKADDPAVNTASKSKAAPAKKAITKSATKGPKSKAAAAKKATLVSDDREIAAKEEETREASAPITANTSKKRKAPEEKTAPVNKKVKHGAVINTAPAEVLDVYVFGGGDGGELGLGTAANAKTVKRPRLNPLLAADKVGVVQIACGGMHSVALTHEGKVFTWGVNDQGACGRDTTWGGGLRSIDEDKGSDDESEDDDDSGLNPKEATPTGIPSEAFPEGTKFVHVAAGDSISVAVTDDGFVWGWGTFRDNTGVLGFSTKVEIQRTPALIPELKNIKYVACGANHVLALDKFGNVFAWGAGQQNQLGRRVVERTRLAGLTPREFGLPKKQIKYIAAGSDHSFAVDNSDNVWAWGLNNFGQCGVFDNAGDDDAVVANPKKIEGLANHKVVCIECGRHNSVGVTDKGELFIWGRCDMGQAGMKLSDIPEENLGKDEHDRPRLINKPTLIQGITAKYAAAGSDQLIAITENGEAYSWGFSGTYQTGQGTDDDITEATLIDNTAVRGKHLNWAGAGGQYSVVTAVASVQPAASKQEATRASAEVTEKPHVNGNTSASEATNGNTGAEAGSAKGRGKAKAAAPPKTTKGKKNASKDAANGDDAADHDDELPDMVDELPKKMQDLVHEQVSKGATVTEENGELHIERETTPELRMHNKHGEISG